jgi:hypothetical protein
LPKKNPNSIQINECDCECEKHRISLGTYIPDISYVGT